MAFSYISVTTGVFTTFEPLMKSSGPRGIWLWPVVVLGQTLVALVYGELAAKIPVAGYSYTWARYLGSPRLGWWLGWLSLASVAIVTVAVDWVFVEQGLGAAVRIPPLSVPGLTLGVIAVQMLLIMASSRVIALINDSAVWTESVGMFVLCITLVAVAFRGSNFNWGHIGGAVEHPWPTGWALVLALLPGAYTLTGFESSSNMIEETHNPRQTVPRVMWLSVVCSGVLGMMMLLVFSSTNPTDYQTGKMVWTLIDRGSSPLFTDFFVKPVVCISMFACGLVMLVTNSRLLHAMARDRCLPGHELLSRIPRKWGTPIPAIGVVALASATVVVILCALRKASGGDVIGSATLGAILMATVLYGLTLSLYVRKGRLFPTEPSYFQLGAWCWPVVVGAGVWLFLELSVFLYAIYQWPRRATLSQQAGDFCNIALTAQVYAAGVVVVGLFIYLIVRRLESEALTFRPKDLPRGSKDD